jgi:hypothetical protein
MDLPPWAFPDPPTHPKVRSEELVFNALQVDCITHAMGPWGLKWLGTVDSRDQFEGHVGMDSIHKSSQHQVALELSAAFTVN